MSDMQVTEDKVHVEYVAVDDLRALEGNPKRHDIEMIASSIRRFGFTQPILVNDETGTIVAGHGRAAAVARLRDAGEAIPERVVVRTDGAWCVPVVRGVHLSEEEARAYAVADNRATELGGWDDRALADILKPLAADDALEGVGYSSVDVDQLLAEVGEAGAAGGDRGGPKDGPGDAVPDPPKNPVARVGDLWRLGDSLVACGDSRDEAVVQRALEGRTPKLMVTDPPYGVDYVGIVNSRGGQKGGAGWKDIEGDTLDDAELQALLEATIGGFGAPLGFLWHPSGPRRIVFLRAAAALGWRVAQEIVWVKHAFVFGRADYHWRHESCLYLKRPGAPKLDEVRNETTVWEVPKPSASDHPTQKPVELYARALRNHTSRGDLLVDPFLGSGTAVVAAAREERVCAGVELEPAYVDVAVARWEAETGGKAKRVRRGRK